MLKERRKMSDLPEKLEIFGRLHRPNQSFYEWMYFLEFCRGYFFHRGVLNPFVVEIGVEAGFQKKFYMEYLHARQHVGIDISPYSPAEIHGDSRKVETFSKLMEILNGDKADLLYIDGAHDFESVESDFEMYAPLTEHIIAFHDLFGKVWTGVQEFWQEALKIEKKNFTFLTFYEWGEMATHGNDIMGIGVMIRKPKELKDANRI